MDAPKKIYLNAPRIQPELDNTTWDTKAWKDCENIEYIHKDALLGKIDEIIATKPDNGGLAVEVATQAVSDIRKIIMSM